MLSPTEHLDSAKISSNGFKFSTIVFRVCMHMYGSELWNFNCSYVDDFKVAWRKVKRRIWKLPCNIHNAIVQNLTYNIDDQLDVRIAKFTHMCLNHDNDVCRSISLSKLLYKKSTFASNYRYLSFKYSLLLLYLYSHIVMQLCSIKMVHVLITMLITVKHYNTTQIINLCTKH